MGLSNVKFQPGPSAGVADPETMATHPYRPRV
jgi:hypothetical protein